jgi:hypothetical protein
MRGEPQDTNGAIQVQYERADTREYNRRGRGGGSGKQAEIAERGGMVAVCTRNGTVDLTGGPLVFPIAVARGFDSSH